MSLRVWLPLTGTLENKGISNYTPTIASGNSWASTGKIGAGAITLTKQQTILPTSSCMTGAKQMSYCYWVKVNTAWETQWLDGIRWISTNGSTTHISRQEFYTNCTLIGTWYQGGSIAGISFTPGEWIHIAVTFNYNTGEVKFYKNGIRVGSATNLDTSHYCRGDFYIGDTGVDICENDVRIYDHCLSAAEVHEISQGLVLHYKLDNAPQTMVNAYSTPIFNTSAAAGGWSHWGQSGASGSYGQNTDKQYIWNKANTYSHYWSDAAGATGNYLLYQSPACDGGYRSLQAIIKEENSSPITEAIVHPAWNGRDGGTPSGKWTSISSLGNGFYLCKCEGIHQDGSNNLVGFYVHAGYKVYISEAYLENNKELCSDILFSSNIVQDSSGYGHNGTSLNTVSLSPDTPRYSASTNLSAADSMINCGRGGMMTDSITVNFWLKSSSWGNPVSCTEGGGWNFESSDTCFRFPVYIASVGYKYGKSATTKAQLCNNEWHMLTGIYDRINQKIQIYVDGKLDNDYTTGTSNNIGYHGTNCIWIGAEATGSNTTASNGMAGLFSDFRIYCTALSAADVKQLYEMGAKVDNKGNWHTYEFKEGGTVAKVKKTGITVANEIYDDMNFKGIAQIVKTNAYILLKGDLNITTTKDGHIKTGGIGSIPAATVMALKGKTLRFIYDVNTLGARSSTEQGQTAYNYTRYGIHGSMSYTNASGTTGTSYPFANQLNYSGDSKHAIQTWVIPADYQSYGAINFSIQNFDKPSSTNNNTWFIRNPRVEVVDGTYEDVTGTNLIEL